MLLNLRRVVVAYSFSKPSYLALRVPTRYRPCRYTNRVTKKKENKKQNILYFYIYDEYIHIHTYIRIHVYI